MTRPIAKLIALISPILTLAIVPLCALGAEHPKIDIEKGWKCLFNGKDLSGWHTVTSDNGRRPGDYDHSQRREDRRLQPQRLARGQQEPRRHPQ
jgi:hypothetical protein